MLNKIEEKKTRSSSIETYITQKAWKLVGLIESCVLFSTDNLKYDYTKAENIRFGWAKSIHCILRRHISTAKKTLSFVANMCNLYKLSTFTRHGIKTYKSRQHFNHTYQINLLSPYYPFCVCLSLFASN